jgi:cytochrome c biogenesis protein CcmG, thiol:disulfide interchange protein DsbE
MPRSVVSAILLTVAACGRPGYPVSASHPLLGRALPAIHHRVALDGKPFDADALAGKPVLVKFFADYCRLCKDTLPAVERLHEAHPEVAFVGIDEDDSVETASALAERYSLGFPVIRDEGNVLSGRFRVSTMPMTFVADASGTIRWVGDEKQTESDLKQAIAAAR